MISRDCDQRRKPMSEEHKLKISEGLKQRQKINPFSHDHWRGRHHSEETKQKQRIASLGDKNPRWTEHPKTKEAGRIRARRLYGVTKGCDIHHKDGNPLNNNPHNILIIPRKRHMEIDGRLENNLTYNHSGGNKTAQP